MRGLQPQQVQQNPQAGQSLVSPQMLGALMQAYKQYQAGQQTMGDTGTQYAAQGGQVQNQNAGFQLGQPVVSGGTSGQTGGMQGSAQNPQLLEALMKARGGQ